MKRTQLPPLRDKRKTAKAKDRLPAVRDRAKPVLWAAGKLERIGAAVLAELLPRTEKLLERKAGFDEP